MAIYHASFQVISRSKGQSSVAAAAYRSGERLVNTATGEIHEYKRTDHDQAIYDSLIIAPDQAPEWVQDREQLWSAVESIEKRKDSQLARELNVALPVELDDEQKKMLITQFCQTEFVERGMVADIAMHDFSSHNPHAHVMLTMREFDGAEFGKKNRNWNDKKLLSHWRESWAEHTNEHLKKAGVDDQIDHRSLEDQGLERLPTKHLGYQAAAMEERGIETNIGDYNRNVIAFNESIKQLTEQLRLLAIEKVKKYSRQFKKLAELAMEDANAKERGAAKYKLRDHIASKQAMNAVNRIVAGKSVDFDKFSENLRAEERRRDKGRGYER